MALAFVNRAENTVSASGVASASTAAASHTTGNLLVVFVSFQTIIGATSVTLSDTAGNTYTAIGTLLARGTNRLQLWYCANCTGNASNIVTATAVGGSAPELAVSVRQFSGAATSSVLEGSPPTATGSGTSISSGSVTVTASEAVIVAGMEADAKNFVAGTGYTLDTFTGASGLFFADEYHIVTASEAATASCSSGAWGICAAAFKAAADVSFDPSTLIQPLPPQMVRRRVKVVSY